MREAQFLKARVSPDVKARVQQAARQQLITESIWLRRSVDAVLRSEPSGGLDIPLRPERVAFRSRVYVRLTPKDRLLLKERAAARGMPAATYVSVLVRAHLRNLTPLPKDELRILKQTVAELGAIGGTSTRSRTRPIRVIDMRCQTAIILLECSRYEPHYAIT